jgi:putative redox protein
MPVELTREKTHALAQTASVGRHALIADATLQEGGDDAGPSPHDLYDAALGACKAITVMWYARKKGIPVEDVNTVVARDDSGERAGIYRLTATLQIRGALSDAQLQELEAVAKKCPVHKLMATVTTEIATEVRRLA